MMDLMRSPNDTEGLCANDASNTERTTGERTSTLCAALLAVLIERRDAGKYGMDLCAEVSARYSVT